MDLKRFESTLSSVLASHQNGVRYSKLEASYVELCGESIPFKALGFGSLHHLLVDLHGRNKLSYNYDKMFKENIISPIFSGSISHMKDPRIR